MDDVAVEKQNLDGSVAVNGEGDGSEQELDNVDGDEKKHSVQNSSPGKIFVGGVAWDTTEETFTKHFRKYGPITDSVIMKDKHTRMPRGFGFVTFADPSIVEKVLDDDHVIDGRTVEVKRTVPREDVGAKGGPKTKKIFVGGLPPYLTEDEFKGYFSSYGTVVEHHIMLEYSSGRSRGFGFVTFESEDTVEEILSDERTHEIGGKQVEIKKAEPKRVATDFGLDGRVGYSGMFGGFGSGAGYGYGGGGFRFGGGYGGRAGGYGGAYVRDGYGDGPECMFGGYGAGYGYGVGFGGGYGGAMFDDAGFSDGYGRPGGYGWAGGYGGNRGGGNGRFHPYGR